MCGEPKLVDAAPAAMAAECGRLEEPLSSLLKTLDEHQDLIEEYGAQARAIREIADSVKTDSIDLLEKSRLLRLGVVGQVKAGKSSLLNMLLFNGQEVLPKAATPMTASLSHIIKSDKDEIEIEYYSREDWEEIKQHADEYRRRMQGPQKNRPADFLQGSHELVEMVKKNRLRVESYLGTTKVLRISLENLNRELRRLVGAEGELTPLVKSVSIRCGQGIPDLDIVDTPGINDPIVSRSRKAKKLLGQCDVVLLLSYAGQFMDSVDAEFFQDRIPQEGATQRLRQLLIGSKFDSALIDESKKYRGDLQEGVSKLKQSLVEHAKDTIERIGEADRSLAIQENDILFMSAMCAMYATRQVSQWSGEERGYFDNLRRAYPDWLDKPEGNELETHTKNTLAMLGNQQAIVEHLDEVRRNKHQIILDSIQDFLQRNREGAVQNLEELIKDLDERAKELVESDLEGVQKQQEAVDEMAKEIGYKVSDHWEYLIDKQKEKGLNELDEWIRSEQQEAREAINQAVDTITKTGKRERAGGRWNWLLLRSKWETYEYEEKVLDDCSAREAIEDLREEADNKVKELSNELFSTKFARDASKRIKEVVSEELSSEIAHSIKPTAIIRAVRQAIDVVARQGRSELEKHRPSFFSPDTELSKQANKGRKQADKRIRSIMNQLRKWQDEAYKVVESQTSSAKEALIPAATTELKNHLDRLKQDIEEREFRLQRYELCKNQLVKHHRELKQSAP